MAATGAIWRICRHSTTSPPEFARWHGSPNHARCRAEPSGVYSFAPDEQALLHAIQDPKGNIAGFRRGDLMTDLARFSLTRLSRQLRRLLDLGVVKRVAGTYRYYLTKAGRAATAAATRLTEATIVPALI